jgi:hypothetical protein
MYMTVSGIAASPRRSRTAKSSETDMHSFCCSDLRGRKPEHAAYFNYPSSSGLMPASLQICFTIFGCRIFPA